MGDAETERPIPSGRRQRFSRLMGDTILDPFKRAAAVQPSSLPT
jgi:hypothetical protein